MSALITDIRQLRRRKQPVGTMPINFEHPFEPTEPALVDTDNMVSTHIIAATPEPDQTTEQEQNIGEAYIVEGVSEYERVDELTAVLRRMQAKNKNIGALIELLDLEPVELIQPPGNARLWELAGKALEPGRIYSKAQAIEAIKVGTGVSQDRAELGFKLMLESKAIEPTVDATTGKLHTDLFYLGGSTPY